MTLDLFDGDSDNPWEKNSLRGILLLTLTWTIIFARILLHSSTCIQSRIFSWGHDMVWNACRNARERSKNCGDDE